MNMYRPEASSFALKRDAIKRKARALRTGRGLQILMVVQELDVEQGDALGRFRWRGRGRRGR